MDCGPRRAFRTPGVHWTVAVHSCRPSRQNNYNNTKTHATGPTRVACNDTATRLCDMKGLTRNWIAVELRLVCVTVQVMVSRIQRRGQFGRNACRYPLSWLTGTAVSGPYPVILSVRSDTGCRVVGACRVASDLYWFGVDNGLVDTNRAFCVLLHIKPHCLVQKSS